MSFETLSTGWFVCCAMISSRRRFRLIVSFAWISMSVPCPWKPPETWWIRILEFGSAVRYPSVPAARRSAPIDIAIPTHVVATSGLMNWIVS